MFGMNTWADWKPFVFEVLPFCVLVGICQSIFIIYLYRPKKHRITYDSRLPCNNRENACAGEIVDVLVHLSVSQIEVNVNDEYSYSKTIIPVCNNEDGTWSFVMPNQRVRVEISQTDE